MPRGQSLDYLTNRARNNAYWAARALQFGSGLSATASTAWVRAAVFRRLRKFVKANSSVLEIGCGNASSLLGPLSGNREAYGIDLSTEMLSLARCHKTLKGLVRSDACYIPFRDASFDSVYTSRCLINVLDKEMQRLAMREAFRVAKPDGSVIFVENFEEPLARVNLARERYGAGPQIKDEHNLLLNLQETLEYCKKLGWNAVTVQGNTVSSFAAHIVFRRYFRWTAGPIVDRPSARICGAGLICQKGGRIADWILYPLHLLLTWLDDCFGARLPLFGKDVMIVFRRA
jgi:ubiquinone/menaquinone biosynthesis C-methylase UbiE